MEWKSSAEHIGRCGIRQVSTRVKTNGEGDLWKCITHRLEWRIR